MVSSESIQPQAPKRGDSQLTKPNGEYAEWMRIAAAPYTTEESSEPFDAARILMLMARDMGLDDAVGFSREAMHRFRDIQIDQANGTHPQVKSRALVGLAEEMAGLDITPEPAAQALEPVSSATLVDLHSGNVEMDFSEVESALGPINEILAQNDKGFQIIINDDLEGEPPAKIKLPVSLVGAFATIKQKPSGETIEIAQFVDVTDFIVSELLDIEHQGQALFIAVDPKGNAIEFAPSIDELGQAAGTDSGSAGLGQIVLDFQAESSSEDGPDDEPIKLTTKDEIQGGLHESVTTVTDQLLLNRGVSPEQSLVHLASEVLAQESKKPGSTRTARGVFLGGSVSKTFSFLITEATEEAEPGLAEMTKRGLTGEQIPHVQKYFVDQLLGHISQSVHAAMNILLDENSVEADSILPILRNLLDGAKQKESSDSSISTTEVESLYRFLNEHKDLQPLLNRGTAKEISVNLTYIAHKLALELERRDHKAIELALQEHLPESGDEDQSQWIEGFLDSFTRGETKSKRWRLVSQHVLENRDQQESTLAAPRLHALQIPNQIITHGLGDQETQASGLRPIHLAGVALISVPLMIAANMVTPLLTGDQDEAKPIAEAAQDPVNTAQSQTGRTKTEETLHSSPIIEPSPKPTAKATPAPGHPFKFKNPSSDRFRVDQEVIDFLNNNPSLQYDVTKAMYSGTAQESTTQGNLMRFLIALGDAVSQHTGSEDIEFTFGDWLQNKSFITNEGRMLQVDKIAKAEGDAPRYRIRLNLMPPNLKYIFEAPNYSIMAVGRLATGLEPIFEEGSLGPDEEIADGSARMTVKLNPHSLAKKIAVKAETISESNN